MPAGLAVVSAAMLSFLPALKVTRARVQPHLANLGTGGATLRFGRVWTGAMIAQVALTAIGIPIAMETASQVMRKVNIRAEFPSREYVAAARRSGASRSRTRPRRCSRRGGRRRSRRSSGASRRNLASSRSRSPTARRDRCWRLGALTWRSHPVPGRRSTSGLGPRRWARSSSKYSTAQSSSAGRSTSGDRSPAARTVIVNEAFVRGFRSRGGSGSPIGARLRYADRSAALGARRTSGSRSSASCATSA